jgi:hypothetical protein
MRAPRTLVLCCALMSCAKLVGIHDYTNADASGAVMADGAGDAGSAQVPICSSGLSLGSNCPSSLAVGVGDTCVIAPDALYCWGQDVPMTGSDVNTPTVVAMPSVPTNVASSTSLDNFGSPYGTTCFLLDGELTCWGNTEVGQVLGALQLTPVPASVLPLGLLADNLAVGGDHVIATRGSAGACWGATSLSQCNTPPEGEQMCDELDTECEDDLALGLGIDVGTLIVAGTAHTCTSPDGTGGITCWGDDSSGQLGTQSSSAIGSVQLSSGSDLPVATGLALGASHSCAIVGSGDDSETYCWGGNEQGQLGVGSIAARMYTATPVMAPSGVHFSAIAAGSDTTCAIDTATNVWCWGADTQGAAGQAAGSDGLFGTFDTPMMTTVTGALAIGVGYEHACAMLATGAIECWGDNQHGELGDGQTQHMNSVCGLDDCSWQPVTVKGH